MAHKVERLSLIICVVLALFISLTPVQAISETVDTYTADVAMDWFDLQLELVQTSAGFSPPVASRAFGYTGVTLYESLVIGMPDYQSLVGQLNELSELPRRETQIGLHYPTVANSALNRITRHLFGNVSEEGLALIEALYEAYADVYQDEVSAVVYEQSVSYGEAMADAIFEWSMDDGGHEGYLRSFPNDYLPPEGSGLWIPTPRSTGDPQPALQPYWRENRSFVPMSVESCAAVPPPEYSEEPDSAFYAEALEVYEAVNQASDEERDIALFWADDPGRTPTPPGHSISILTQILEMEDASLALAAQAYARMGIAVADAFISCWDAKYEYNLVRPISYIHDLMDADWVPIVDTPPFPEYTSGHSVQTAAAASVLIALFGDDYAFTDHTHDERGLEARSFSSFTEMAEETALSRLYGGIHYRSAIEVGVEQGFCIGEQVNALEFRKTDS